MDSPGNREPFVRRLTECQSRLYAYVLALPADPTSANEVLGETNVTLWRKAAEFQEGSNFGAWAVRVAPLRSHGLSQAPAATIAMSLTTI